MSTFPTCQVCNQQFSLKGPAPFLLPCLHPVCETCVTSADGGLIECRPCQRDVNLTETPLQKDVVREREILTITVQHHPELVLCTHEEDGNQAVCWCKECDDFLCEHCQMVHNSFKGTRKHFVQNIGELQPGSLEEELYCKTHPEYILDTWDESCCILICGKCRLDEHSQHKAVKIEHAAEIARREVANLQKDAQSAVDEHAALIAAAEKDLGSYDEKYKMIPDQIGHTLHSLKTAIDQREKELQIELQQNMVLVRDDLGKKKNKLEASHQRFQTTLEYIKEALEYSSDHDIMALRHNLRRQTGDCSSSDQGKVKESQPFPCFNTSGFDKLKSALSVFGAISTKDDLMMGQPTEDGGAMTREPQSTSGEIEELRKELEQLKEENQNLKEKFTREKKEERHDLYRLKANVTDAAFLLHCTEVEFNRTKYNAKCVHINKKGELINKQKRYPPRSDQRLKMYEGTSSTVPLPRHGSPQYFEVESRVGIEKRLGGSSLLLEIALATEEDQDLNYDICGCLHSYSLTVSHVKRNRSICEEVRKHGINLVWLPDTLENTSGTSATLHYGVVYDSARSRIAFLDINDEKIMCRIRDVDNSVSLWPMFGLYNPDKAFVSMSLVVGSDINMTERKKALILKSLS